MAPNDKLVTTTSVVFPDRTFWGTTTNGVIAFKKGVGKGLYSFSLFDMSADKVVDVKLDPSDTRRGIFEFSVNPSSYEVSEPASTTITATQNGGKFVESHGSLFKDIRISGTVGFRPKPEIEEIPNKTVNKIGGAVGVSTQVPESVARLTPLYDERGLHRKEVTGFDDFIFLRNMFREYWDRKSKPSTGNKIALIWTYAKEAESYVVEPLNFTTTRDSSNPLSWIYTIQLRALYRYDTSIKYEGDTLDWLDRIDQGHALFNKTMQDTVRILNSLAKLSDFILNLPYNFYEDLVGGFKDVLSGLGAIKNSFDFSKLHRDRISNINTIAKQGLSYLSKTKKSRVTSIITGSTSALTDSGQSGTSGKVMSLMRDSIKVCNTLLSLGFIWKESRQQAVSDYSAAYTDIFGNPPLSSGSPLNVSNIRLTGSAREDVVFGGESIRDAAKRLMGDDSHWKTLAVLNGLRFPYISNEGGDGVLCPGDSILVPIQVDDTDSLSKVSQQQNKDQNYENLTPAVRNYGRDLRISNSATNVELADISVSQRGDLDTIEGLPNVDQAVMIKFSTERGELATHPNFGTKYPIGSKVPDILKLQEFSLNTQRTLRQDPRIENIEDLATRVIGDKIYVNAKLKLIKSDTKLPITFAVRR